ncbi:MAG: ABC transporter permease [candidate division NC10 bacterium]|nr:ABC transporter permease [candidate division NC10 bacterium]
MLKYTIRRLLALIPILLGVISLVFLMFQIIPGDPARLVAGEEASAAMVAALRLELGLEDPLYIQYIRYVGNVLRGNLGRSIRSGRPVTQEILARYPATVELAAASTLIMILLGVPAGILSATHRRTLIDNASVVVAIGGASMPVFWLGLMLMLLFSVWLGWFPATGKGGLAHLVLPSLTLGASSTAILARLTRSSLLEVIRADFVRTARAKGLPERLVVYKHSLKNALIPVITITGLQFGSLLGGAVLTETVFAWPGIGRLMVDSIAMRDFPVVQGAILLVAATFVLINLVVDLLYAWVDPRIRYG